MNINIADGKVKVVLNKTEKDSFGKLAAQAKSVSDLAKSIARQDVDQNLISTANALAEVLFNVVDVVGDLENKLIKHEKGG